MKANVKRSNLYDNAYAYAYRDADKFLAKEFIKELSEYIDKITIILKKDISQMDNAEFLSLIQNIYSIELNNDTDILNIISRLYNKKYFSTCLIYTNMFDEIQKSEDRGKNFSWWTEYNQIAYKVAFGDEYTPSIEKIYTSEEIQQLIDEKKLVLIEEHSIEHIKLPEYELKPYTYLPCWYDSITDDDYSLAFVDYLKTQIPEEKLLSDIKLYLDNIRADMYLVMQRGILSTKIDEYAREYYENSVVKENIDLLTRKLK